MGVTPYTVEKLSTFCNNLIGCKTGFNVTWVVKRATSLFKSFAAILQNKLPVFVARFTAPSPVFFVVFLFTGDEEN